MLIALNASLSTALAVSRKFLECGVFFVFIHLKYFLISFMISSSTRWLFRTVLFNFHIFVSFPNFLPLVISNFIPLRLQQMVCTVSILFNVLRCVLWTNVWSFLENVPCELEKNVIAFLKSHLQIASHSEALEART